MDSKEYLKKTVRPELISKESISVALPTEYIPILDKIIGIVLTMQGKMILIIAETILSLTYM